MTNTTLNDASASEQAEYCAWADAVEASAALSPLGDISPTGENTLEQCNGIRLLTGDRVQQAGGDWLELLRPVEVGFYFARPFARWIVVNRSAPVAVERVESFFADILYTTQRAALTASANS